MLALVGLALSVRIVQQYEQGVLFRLGRVIGVREPGLRLIIPFVDVLRRVSLRIVTMPIQSQGIITRDNVSVDVSAVAYFRVVDATKSVVAIENVAARDQPDRPDHPAQGRRPAHPRRDAVRDRPDQLDIREILDRTTDEWGVEVTLVELKDIQLPESMKRAMARQAEAEREKRAKIIDAEGESLAAAPLGEASDIMMAHPLALAAAQPAEPGRDRGGQEHHRGVPGAADEHHRGARRVPGPRASRRHHPNPSAHHPGPTARPPPRPPSSYRRPMQSSTPTTNERPPPVREGDD